MGGDLYTSASGIEVGVAFIAPETSAPVPGAIGGVGAVAVGAPARVGGVVELGGAAVVDVPDGPVQRDGHDVAVGGGAEAVRGHVEAVDSAIGEGLKRHGAPFHAEAAGGRPVTVVLGGGLMFDHDNKSRYSSRLLVSCKHILMK